MPGQIKKMIDTIIQKRAQGNSVIMNTTKAKIALKGINTDRYTDVSQDEPETIKKLKQIALEFGIALN